MLAVALKRNACMASHLVSRSLNASHVRQTLKCMADGSRALCDSAAAKETIEKNPYYEKYKASIAARLKEMEDKGEKVELPSLARQGKVPAEETESENSDTSDVQLGSMARSMHGISQPEPAASPAPKKIRPKPPGQTPAIRTLDSVMKVDLIKDKTAEEITEIWKEHHRTKDGIHAVIPSVTYSALHARASKCPRFVFPLPRKDGLEFFYCEFTSHQFLLTSLLSYKSKKENAPPMLTLIHFTELREEKGIVLMFGEFDENCLNVLEAQCLANQLKTYYTADEDSKFYKLLEQFNFSPNEFDHQRVVALLEETGMSLLQQHQQQKQEESQPQGQENSNR